MSESSSAIYERLLHGDATSAEYVEAVRAENRKAADKVRGRITARYDRRIAERDRLQRLFNRLEAAITHHKTACEANDIPDTHDEALWAARDRVLKDAQEGTG